MKVLIQAVFAVFILYGLSGSSSAQLQVPNAAGASMGHLHYFVKDMDLNRKFWLALGAQPVMLGTREVLKFSGVMVLLTQAQTPEATAEGTEGSVINHVGFRVPNTLQMLEKLKALGYKTELAESGTGKVGSVYGPEGERIEFLEDQSINVKFVPDTGRYEPPPKMTVPIALHHIHYFVPDADVAKIQAWYVKFFGAVPGKRFRTDQMGYVAMDLPGVNLNVSGHERLPGIKGRRLDHIGFEIRNLEAFCKKLEAMGVKLDRPYTKLPTGIANAYVTDPWGTNIELTEGLNQL
jgi:catechol 2,3-dioxygenase-like lactoylglutathione lyase family enzyme